MAVQWSPPSSPRSPAATAGGVLFRPSNSVRRSQGELRRLLTGLFVLAGGLVIVALVHVSLRLAVTQIAYRLSAVRQAVDRLEEERRELELEVATAESPARLEELGRALGLAAPKWRDEVAAR